MSKLDYEEIIAIMPGHVYWLDHHNVYQGCNEQQSRAFGFASKHDVIGKKNKDFSHIPPEVYENWDKNNHEVMTKGISKIFEEIMVLEDGKKLFCLSHKKAIFDKNGNVIGLLGTSIDIDERIESINKLKEERNNLDLAFENIISNLPGHIYWLDQNNVFLGCNESQAKSAGLKSRHEIVGKTNYDMPWSSQAAALNLINNEVMATGKEYSIEELLTLSNGQETIFISKKVPLRDNMGNTVGIMGISFDITERKKMEKEIKTAKEEAECANKAKTIFLENMRHDIRTPLCGMIGFSELLLGEKNHAQITEYAEQLAECSKELLRFLNEILESLNVSTGEIPLLKKRFDLKTVLENVIRLHSPTAKVEDLELKFYFDENIPKCLLGDPIRIYRIMLELLVNALKFTKQGYVKVSAELVQIDNREVIIKIEVEDTGIGIPLENQQELFVRFKRLIPSYQGIYKGAGLGLSIIKQFIDDLQGEIDITSAPNKGTKCTCLIPLKKSLLNELPEKADPVFTDLCASLK